MAPKGHLVSPQRVQIDPRTSTTLSFWARGTFPTAVWSRLGAAHTPLPGTVIPGTLSPRAVVRMALGRVVAHPHQG
jgi:hypothetical protein